MPKVKTIHVVNSKTTESQTISNTMIRVKQ